MPTKLLIGSLVLIGVMVLSGAASASTAETLQPASVQTINDELVVNNVARFDSVYVDGVTVLNGSLVNNTTDDDGNSIPVTISDDMRIDGRIYRGATAGTSDSLPVIINDNVEVIGTITTNTATVDELGPANASSNGMVKAGGWVNGRNLTFMNDNYFNPLGGEMEITRNPEEPVGSYFIDLGFNVSESYVYVNNVENCLVVGVPASTFSQDAIYTNKIVLTASLDSSYYDCNFQFLVF